jgi:1-acyl-sn-glycerol-3-phosphate acyltransferase
MAPPRLRRRLTVALVLSLAVAVLAASPVLLLAAAMAHALGRRKPLIAVRLVVAYCLHEIAVLTGACALWLLSAGGACTGRPRIQRLHWSLLRWYVRGLARRALALLEIVIREDIADDAARWLRGEDPVIVLSRHAGPGDTVFLIDRLLSRWHRSPSVVLDPAIGLLTSRLPHGVIDNAQGDDAERVIEALAANLGPGGALLLYPEGGNFTRERRRSAVASLRRRGRTRAAAAAQQMDNVLPPRPAGVLAALRGAPQAPIVFVAHTGLGLAAYPRQIYRELPIGRTLRFRVWLVARDDVPETEAGQIEWLNRRWKDIDEWVASQGLEAR